MTIREIKILRNISSVKYLGEYRGVSFFIFEGGSSAAFAENSQLAVFINKRILMNAAKHFQWKEISVENVKTLFVVLHEMGHLIDPKGFNEDSAVAEDAADKFAVREKSVKEIAEELFALFEIKKMNKATAKNLIKQLCGIANENDCHSTHFRRYKLYPIMIWKLITA